jgi:hypothetical protein
MFRFGSRGDSSVYGVVFDIGSGSVGAAIVESNPERSLPTLIYSTRSSLRLSDEAQDARRVREALLAASLTLSQEGQSALRKHDSHGRITRMLVTCSSPWSHTLARSISYENDEPFKITKTLIHDLAESAEQEILSQLRAQNSRVGESFEVVERATMDIAINDYVILNPIHKTGISCSLAHMVGLVPTEIVSALHEVQSKLFPSAELKIHTYLLGLYCVLRDLYPGTHAFSIIDVTSEATELGIVEGGLLVENISIPFGTNTFLRGIMKETGSPASDIETMIAAERNGHLVDRDELKGQIAAYAESLRTAIDTLTARRALPRDTALTTRHPYEQLFGDMVRNAILAGGIEPHMLDLEHTLLHEVVPGLTPDTHIALIARFFHKLHGCGELTDAAAV